MSNLPTEQSAVLLGSILRTLEQINEKLSIQERREDRPGEGQERPDALPSSLGETREACTPLPPLNTINSQNSLHHGESVGTKTLRQVRSYECTNHDLGAPLVVPLETEDNIHITPDYRSWRSPLKESPLHQHSFLTEELGDAWTMPDDGRLPLSFSREVLEGLNPDQLHATVSCVSEFRDRIARSSDLCFHVIDYDALGRNIVYRLGKPTMIGWQQWKPPRKINSTPDAPWRRFVLCQGLNAVQGTDYESAVRAGCWDQAPFILHNDRCNTRNYITTAIASHVECWESTLSVTNPYENYWAAFHITFYEASSDSVPKVTRNLPRGQWRHGSLYGLETMDFCESALTLIAIPSMSYRPYRPLGHELEKVRTQNERMIIKDFACHEWTILLLAPLGFFDTSYHQFPLEKFSFMASFGGRSMEGAIVTLLEATYDLLHYNWSLFKKHFQELLDQGDEEIALFEPALHDQLLQDDEKFSRSRRYAWAIKCLTNFERSIGDNILQWRRFKSARLDHLCMSVSSRKSIDKIEQYCIQLEALHQYFAMKLESTRALRDGLFSASAVIESRESTRLAKTIRLLTFVSIFFQPLAFCTSLWSINNTFSPTALIYTSIAVGLSTYLIVFHLNSLVYQTTSAYTPMRETLIARMRNDRRQHWASKGKQFATFQPKHETLQPSEWWILLFVFQGLFTSLPRLLSRKNDPAKADTEASPAATVLPGADGAAPESAGDDRPHAVEGASTAATASCTSDDCSQPPAREVPA